MTSDEARFVPDHDSLLDAQALWETAQDAWWSANPALAFHYCHTAIARGLDTPEAYGLLGSIAIQLGRFDTAQTYLRAALDRAGGQRVGEPRYLVIHPWGCGFWGEVDHVLSQLAIAEFTGRIPIVYWGRHRFFGTAGIENAWDAYLQPVSQATVADAERHRAQATPPLWVSRELRRPQANDSSDLTRRTSSLLLLAATEPVAVADCHNRLVDILPWAPKEHRLAGKTLEEAYRDLIARYMRLTPALAQAIEKQSASLLRRRPVLAVHYRAQASIKANELKEGRTISPSDYVPSVDRFLADHPQGSVFLLTDVAPVARAFGERYGDRLVMLDARRLDHDDELALHEVDFVAGRKDEGYRLAVEVITDAYVAAACDAFLGDGASNVSCMIGFLKDWAPGTFHLLRANILLEKTKIQPF